MTKLSDALIQEWLELLTFESPSDHTTEWLHPSMVAEYFDPESADLLLYQAFIAAHPDPEAVESDLRYRHWLNVVDTVLYVEHGLQRRKAVDGRDAFENNIAPRDYVQSLLKWNRR